MSTLLRLEIRRMLTDTRFLILMLAMPIAMYLLFSTIFAGTPPVNGMSEAVRDMISMAAFGAIGAALMATAPRIAQERTNGWLRQLRIMPVSTGQVITAKVLAAMTWGLPAIVLVDLTAVVAHGVTMPAWQWVAIGGLLWLGTAPFAALGTFLGYLTGGESAFGVTYGIYLFLAALGGLWMPVTILPTALQHIATVLPSNRFAELGWRIAGGAAPTLVDAAMLAGWLVVFTGLAGVLYRRSNALR
ncbi:MAG TPA: ABC transporter permease [Pseudonocardiaceae bacterium]|nr:ABC transporter permease [Pseudonocardiaceae bacterium]